MTDETRPDPIRDATEAVLSAAIEFEHINSDEGSGTHARAMGWAEFVRCLMNYHMAELALLGTRCDADGEPLPQRPLYVQATEAKDRAGWPALCPARVPGPGLRQLTCARGTGHGGSHVDTLTGTPWGDGR